MPTGSAPRGRWLGGSRDTWQVFNLGNTHPEKVSALIGYLEQGLGRKANITRAPITAGDVPVTYADVSHARERLGYSPQVSLAEGVARFLHLDPASVPARRRHGGGRGRPRRQRWF